MRDLRNIEKRLVAVIKAATGMLPAEELADMVSLCDAGEPGVALDNFCTQLYEYDVALPADVLVEAQAIATEMEMELPQWMREKE